MKAALPLISFILILAVSAHPQEATFRVDANLVLTPVWVADSEGKAIRNLTSNDFIVEENGKRVAAARLGDPGEAPLEMALLFDMSGSVMQSFELERTAASRFLKRIMRPYDSVFILSIANEPRIVQNYTHSLDVALKAVAAISPTTQATALYDSIAKAAIMLSASEHADARRVIIVITDGEDNRSIGNKPEDIIEQLQRADSLFYGVNPRGRSFNYFGRRAQEAMDAFANQTGGAIYVTDKEEGLALFFDHIADELQEQYLLGYYSPSTGNNTVYRKISIAVKDRPEFTVKARPGYYPK
jgi:Ca-activated chloride channel homolog